MLIQLNRRLRRIEEQGLSAELERIRRQAEDFREKIKSLPFEIVSESLSSGRLRFILLVRELTKRRFPPTGFLRF